LPDYFLPPAAGNRQAGRYVVGIFHQRQFAYVVAALETANAMRITRVLFSNHDGGTGRLLADLLAVYP
jgi:hypothetical protein